MSGDKPAQLALSHQPYLNEASDGGGLLAGECEDCAQLVFPPPAVCPFCMGERMRTVQISRRGQLYSYSLVAQGAPEFEQAYVVAYIDMPEGVRVFTQLIDVDPNTLTCDMLVELRLIAPKLDRYGRPVGQFKFAPVVEPT